MISSESCKNEYEGNGVTTVFAYSFKIFDDDDIKVVKTTAVAQTTLVKDTDYTVSGVGQESGGNITYPISGSPLAAGEFLTITRNIALTQLTDFFYQGGFNPETHETALDKLVMMIQQIYQRLTDDGIVYLDTDKNSYLKYDIATSKVILVVDGVQQQTWP